MPKRRMWKCRQTFLKSGTTGKTRDVMGFSKYYFLCLGFDFPVSLYLFLVSLLVFCLFCVEFLVLCLILVFWFQS